MEKAKKIVPEGWFKWERPGIDFPFYNDDSVPAWHAWLLIGVTLLVAVVMNVTTFLQVGGTAFKAFLVFLLPLAALLFVAHGNIGAIIKKPRLGDIPLILIVTVLSMVYSLAAGSYHRRADAWEPLDGRDDRRRAHRLDLRAAVRRGAVQDKHAARYPPAAIPQVKQP